MWEKCVGKVRVFWISISISINVGIIVIYEIKNL